MPSARIQRAYWWTVEEDDRIAAAAKATGDTKIGVLRRGIALVEAEAKRLEVKE